MIHDYNYTYIEFSKSQAFPTALYFRLSASVRVATALSTAFNMHICVHLFFHFINYGFPPSKSGSSLKQSMPMSYTSLCSSISHFAGYPTVTICGIF